MADIPFPDLTRDVAGIFKVSAEEMWRAIKGECFPKAAASDAQMLMFLSAVQRYRLNPFMKEIFPAISEKTGKLLIGIQVDGWITIAHRDPRFKGFKPIYERNDDGKVVAVTCQIFRNDWSIPGEFRAEMAEWCLPSKETWKQRPVHQLFVKAFNGAVRFTFGLGGIYDTDDIERIQSGAISETDVIYQPSSATSSLALEHQPLEAMPIMPGVARETVPVGEREHLKVKLDEVQAPAGAEVAAESAVAPSQDGISASSENAPAAPPSAEPKKRKRAADPVAAQTAAGLEVIDPNERPLETFLRVHDVPATRINLQLAKHGVAKLTDLSAEQEAQVLAVLERSIR